MLSAVADVHRNGEYQGIERPWLRWYDAEGNWVLTDTEQERQAKNLALRQVEQEKQWAGEAEQRAGELAQRLQDLGMDV